jgi:hypothetical protein
MATLRKEHWLKRRVLEQSAEEDIWTWEEINDRKLEHCKTISAMT